MAVTEADHVSFPVHQSQVYTHVSKLMDFPSSHEMALSHMEGSAKLIISVIGLGQSKKGQISIFFHYEICV